MSGIGVSVAWADALSVGPAGIESKGLGLSGASFFFGIGMEELNRPGVPGFDNAANSHPNVPTFAASFGEGFATANTGVGSHAQQVAGVMISTHATHLSVAPGASLYAGYRNPAETAGNIPGAHAEAAQFVAESNREGVSAINMSFGTNSSGVTLDGSSILTRFVDYSAGQSDVLYVVAGNEDTGGFAIPTDNFNGMTVGYTRTKGGVFREADPGNLYTEDAAGARRTTDILAPGTSITMPTPGGGFAASSGTSFAAPHVTGTAALLQEHVENEILAGTTGWNFDAARHEVTKVVMMNSAEKIIDDGTVSHGGSLIEQGHLLGMGKTIIDRPADGGNNWLASDAFVSEFIPLDLELGVGQLNARRSVKQLDAGEHNSTGTATVPAIGWDWSTTTGLGDVNKYVLDSPLPEDSFIAITLGWDREITLNDFGEDGAAGTLDAGEGDNKYDFGESFNDLGMTDLDLYLMPKGETNISNRITGSLSSSHNLEHIFFQIPSDGEYEIWVRQADTLSLTMTTQDYALAWWAVPEPSSVLLLGLCVAVMASRRRRRGA